MTATLDADVYRASVEAEFRRLKGLADRALDQVPDQTAFFACLDPEANSLAILVKHLAGNLRSRWRGFLTEDGEKPDRDRDGEFVIVEGDTRPRLMAEWEEGWRLLFEAVGALTAEQVGGATVTIRGEPHTVLEALQRQLGHYAYHVGQIVLLARHAAGPGWRSLSIPRGRSAEFNANPRAYLRRPKSDRELRP